MATFGEELAFVGAFWSAVDGDVSGALVLRAQASSGAIEDGRLRRAYEVVSTRLAKGEPCGCDDAACIDAVRNALDGDGQLLAALVAEAGEPQRRPLADIWTPIRLAAAARGQLVWLERRLEDARAMVREGKPPAEILAAGERWCGNWAQALQERGLSSAPQTRAEVTDALRAKLDVRGLPGVPWPWSRLNRAIGPIIPKKVYGITGLHGGGKSVLTSNVVRSLIHRGTPCIIVPTEMGVDWMARAYASATDVPQYVAESGFFDLEDAATVRFIARQISRSSEEDAKRHLAMWRDQWRQVVEEYARCPWALINVMDLSVDEMLTRAKILRGQWPGKHVVLVVDHMHNIEYQDGKTDLFVGAGVKRIKDMVDKDADGGMSAVLLFQPRKAEKGQAAVAAFSPIPAGEAAGKVAMHLDVHFSVHKSYVYTHEAFRTDWGTPRTVLTADGLPRRLPPREAMKPEMADQVKVDDEHIYLSIDKRRAAIPGEGGGAARVTLSLNPVNGHVFEPARREHQEAA
jgi:hypothetical protein